LYTYHFRYYPPGTRFGRRLTLLWPPQFLARWSGFYVGSMSWPGGPGRPLLWALGALTVVSGVVDAVSYLGLGRVFTANMTGNVVLLGFAAAGAPGFSVAASLASLGAFLVGAVGAGRLVRRLARRRSLLLAALVIEGGLIAGACVVAYAATSVSTGWARFVVIVLLALGMGVRNAVIRRLAVSDVTTTVLTMTLTGLAADSSMAGGDNARAGRRAGAVGAMLLGAFAGAWLYLRHGAGLPLAVAAILVLGTAAAFGRAQASRLLDVPT
jgi:uncharacterized membrane protein YoaK (UPF0700 family)